jgi:hypothetical protein
MNYVCCFFCGEAMASASIGITSFLVATNWNRPEDKQQSQQFFCHLEGLERLLAKDIPNYLRELSDDIENN